MAPALAMAMAVAGAVAAGPASAAQAKVRIGSTTPLPRGAHVTGAARATTRLRLTIALQPRNPLALKRYATAVSTPGSKVYGHYLSVPQFARRFGPSPEHLAQVERTLRRQGLTVGAATANNLTVPVSGSVAQIEHAFSVSMRQVRTSSGRIAHTNAQAPAVSADIAPWVQGVIGLDNTVLDQPAGLVRHRATTRNALASPHAVPHVPTNGGPQPCSSAVAVQSSEQGLTADELATAYGFSSFYGQGDFGQNQHIALVEEQPFTASDVATYQACYTINAPVNTINVGGGPTPGADDGESALDIEVVAGMAPQATIDVYQGPSGQPVPILSAIVSANVDKVISSSYGICEALTGAATISAENTLLQEAAAQGQSFFISSGDSGSSMCFQAQQSNTGLSVIDPGGQPFATSVGGTALYTTGAGGDAYYTPGSPVVQGVWNDGYNGTRASGTGGGISSSFTMPGYQSGAPLSLGVQTGGSGAPCGSPNTLCREVPDVSADADPNTGYAVYSNGGSGPAWGSTGGTSAAAPLWAAFTLLSNDLATCRGLPLGFVNPSLYSLAGSALNTNFLDVINPSPFTGAANNDALGINNGMYPVQTGYDMATGLGSMTPSLATSLCSARAPVYVVALTTPPAQASVVGTPVALQIAGTDSGGQGLTYAATGLPAGLAISTTGAITGTPTTPGVSSVTVTATDPFTNTGSTAAFSWTVTAPPPPPPPPTKKPATNKPINVKLTGLAKGTPSLSFGWNVAKGSPALTALAIKLPKGLSFASVKKVSKGLVVKASGKKVKDRVTLQRGVLTITLAKKATRLTVSLSKPALKITRAEATKIKKKKVKSLKLTVTATNAKKKTVARSVTVSKLS